MLRQHFENELESVRKSLVEMGETTITLLLEALRAGREPSSELALRAKALEEQTDNQHRLIHDQCLNLITLQAPVARDARMVTGILDAIVDLELIGDYACEIVSLSASLERRPPSQLLSQIEDLGNKISGVLSAAIDSWRSGDREVAVAVRPLQAPIRSDCEALYQKLSQLDPPPGQATAYVDLMLILKHLERILRHAVCVADQAADAAPVAQARTTPAGS